MRGATHVHHDPVPAVIGDDLDPQPPVVNEGRERDPNHDQGRAGPDDIHAGVLGDLQPGELLGPIAHELEAISRASDLEQVGIVVKDPGLRLHVVTFPDGQLDRRVFVLHRFGIHRLFSGIKTEVRHKVRHGKLEAQLVQRRFFLPLQIDRPHNLVGLLVFDVHPSHFNPIPGVAVAGLVEPDAFVHQRIVHGDRLR